MRLYKRENLKNLLHDVEDAFKVLRDTRTYTQNYELQKKLVDLLFKFRECAENDVVYYIYDEIDKPEFTDYNNKSYIKKLKEFARCIGVYSTYLSHILEDETVINIMIEDVEDINNYDVYDDNKIDPEINTVVKFKNGLCVKITSEVPSNWGDKSIVWKNDYKKMVRDGVVENIRSVCWRHFDQWKRYNKENI